MEKNNEKNDKESSFKIKIVKDPFNKKKEINNDYEKKIDVKREFQKKKFTKDVLNLFKYYKMNDEIKNRIDNFENSKKIIEGFHKKGLMLKSSIFLGISFTLFGIYSFRNLKWSKFIKIPLHFSVFLISTSGSLSILNRNFVDDIYKEDFEIVGNDPVICDLMSKEFDNIF